MQSGGVLAIKSNTSQSETTIYPFAVYFGAINSLNIARHFVIRQSVGIHTMLGQQYSSHSDTDCEI